MTQPPWFGGPNRPWPPRRSVKPTPTAEQYRQRRVEMAELERSRLRHELKWKRRTEVYQLTIHGVFTGWYNKPSGSRILVRGSTVAQIRYEVDSSAIPLRWQRVAYEPPR